MILYRCNPPYDCGRVYRMRSRRVEWWGNCGPARFPIVFYVLEAQRVERRWWGYKRMSAWYRAGPETYTRINDV